MSVAPAKGLASLQLNCRDPDAIAAFFTNALGFRRVSGRASSGRAILTLGGCRLELAPLAAGASATPVAAPGWSLSFQHFAIAVKDMEAAFAQLRSVDGWTPISTDGPQRLPAASGGVTAYKFRDPDGHPLELLTFPEDAPANGTTPRIDHSAISVSDTARSVAFYQGLGFAISRRSLNEGPEQDRLDGLQDVQVEVTALSLPDAAGPHLELLCYRGDYSRTQGCEPLEPLAATRLVLKVDGFDLLRAIATGYSGYIARPSPGPETLLLRDPDGHVLKIEAAA